MVSAPPPDQSDPPENNTVLSEHGEDVGDKIEVNRVKDLKKQDGSWVSVAQEKKCLKKVDVEVVMKEGKQTVEIPGDILQDTTPLWEDFIVGKFLDLAPHIAKVHMVVNKIWKYGDLSAKVDVYDVDAITMRFRISNPKAREKIIRRGMWNIAGVTMLVKKWTPRAEEEKQEEDAIPMWVHLHKVPLHMFSWEALSLVTSPVGVPTKLHPETLACENFEVAKVFVNVDVSKTLPKEITFTKDGRDFTVEYEYPWLPTRCGICEKWGHVRRVCAVKRKGKMKEDDGQGLEVKHDEKLQEKVDTGGNEEIQSKELASDGGSESQLEKSLKEKELVETSGQGETRRESTLNEWSQVTPGRVGRSTLPQESKEKIEITASKYSVLKLDVEDGEIFESEQMEDDINDEEEQREEMEDSDQLEDSILSLQDKEKEKSGMKKVTRRQKTKAQGANPVKSLRSSRRNH